MNDDELKKRTRWAVEYVCRLNKLTNKTLAVSLGLRTGSNVSQYRSMAVRPSPEFTRLFCGKYGFSYEWLYSGVGEPFYGAREKYPEVCGPKTKEEVQYDKIKKDVQYHIKEAQMVYNPSSDYLFSSDQKINIEEAMGKAYKVLNAGTALSVALYMNIQQFAAALDTGIALQLCQDQMKVMQEQIDALNHKVDRLTAAPVITEGQGDGSVKKAM